MSGINKLLYGSKDENIDKMLTKEEVKQNLHIKDDRTFYNLINEMHLPYIKIGRQYLVPAKEYNKWIKNNLSN